MIHLGSVQVSIQNVKKTDKFNWNLHHMQNGVTYTYLTIIFKITPHKSANWDLKKLNTEF